MSLPEIFFNILENSKELDRLRKEQEIVFVEINKMHKKLKATPEMVEKPGDMSLCDLRALYIRGKQLSESEETISTSLTKKLDVLLSSETTGQPRRRIGKGKIYCSEYSSNILASLLNLEQPCIVQLHEGETNGREAICMSLETNHIS